MIPLILTVIEFSIADSYGTVAFQVSSSDNNFTTGDMVRMTVSLEFIEALNVGDKFTGNFEKVVPISE